MRSSSPPALRLVKNELRGARSSLRHDVSTSMWEGCAYSIMVGMGETYIPAFVLAVGMGQVSAGLVTTLPLLAGSLFQLLVPMLVAQLGSYRRWVVAVARVQSLVFLVLVVASIVGKLPTTVMFFIAALYWAAGMAITPAWYCWITTIVPSGLRTNFFARRTRYTQLFALFGFLLGGILLHLATHGQVRAGAFTLVFFAAFFARHLSARWLSTLSEPSPPKRKDEKVSWRLYGTGANHCAEGKQLLVYMLAVQTATNIASPYFNSYMLGQLKLCYMDYALLIASSFLAKAITLPWLGRVAKRYSPHTVLWIGGIGLALNPLLWLFSSSLGYLILVQTFSGFVWAAYELASLLIIMEKVNEQERGHMMTTYNLGNAIMITTASLLGGSLLDLLGVTQRGYMILFAVSAVARFTTLFALKRLTPRPVEEVFIPIRHLSLQPFAQVIDFVIAPLRAMRSSREDYNSGSGGLSTTESVEPMQASGERKAG